MPRIFLGLGLVAILSATAFAQQAPYDPYAKPTEEDLTPVRPDGKLNWPPFFKTQALESRFQEYAAMGSCTGSRKDVVSKLSDNKVDVNRLPEKSLTGVAVKAGQGMLGITDSQRQSLLVLMHPAGVSKVSVTGTMSPADLRPGMMIRFAGRIDEHGKGLEPVEQIEVFTPEAGYKGKEVVADRQQKIEAAIVRAHGTVLQLMVKPGRLHKLTFQTNENPMVLVSDTTLSLVSAGDEVSTKGHTYSSAGANVVQVLFASEITVKKVFPRNSPSQGKVSEVQTESPNASKPRS